MKENLKAIFRKIFRHQATIINAPMPIKFSEILNNIMLQNGRIWAELNKQRNIKTIHEAEFKVFSQWGDDGIIQYLIDHLKIESKVFVEFGVEDYTESNTRFLLINNNWSGLVMDGTESNILKIRQNEIYWKYDLIAKFAFVTSENINQIIEEEGITGEIGLLHIDIDGNDYWVWKALKIIDPIIIIVEYNSNFGIERSITVPYKADFYWTREHYSNLYFGSSILSLCDLAVEKGYSFIGCNSAGNNAYFVKNQFLKDLQPLSAKEGFVQSKFRQSRDEEGNLNYLTQREIEKILTGLPVFNTRSNTLEIF